MTTNNRKLATIVQDLASSDPAKGAAMVGAEDGEGGLIFTKVQGALSWIKGRLEYLASYLGATIVGYKAYSTGYETTVSAELDKNWLAKEDRLKALRSWFVSTGLIDRVTCDIVTISDSILEGYNMTTPVGVVSWRDLPMHKFRTEIQKALNPASIVGGDGYIPVGLALGTAPADYPVVCVGGAFSNNSVGLGIRARSIGVGNTITYTFTTTVANARVRIYHYQNSVSGSYRWTLDGGATEVVVATNATTLDFVRTNIQIITPGSHTLVVSGESGTVLVDGFFHEDGDKTRGVRVWEGGHASAPTNFFTTASTVLGQQLAAIAPSLVIIELGANDYTGINPPNSPAKFRTNILSIISTIRGGSRNPAIVLVGTWLLGTTFTPVANWTEYTEVLQDIAGEDDKIAYMDASIFVRAANYPVTTAEGLLSDTAHLTLSGGNLIASALVDFVTPR